MFEGLRKLGSSIRSLKDSEESPRFGEIVACFGTEDDYKRSRSLEWRHLPTTHVDYYGSARQWEQLDQKNGGKHTYVISSIDDHNKSSDKYADCTGIVVVGAEKGKNISLLTHQDPKPLKIPDVLEQYTHDLTARLEEMRDRAEPGSVDMIIFGGWTVPDYDAGYKRSVKMLGEIGQKVLGIDPTIVLGPNNVRATDTRSIRTVSVTFDTDKRRLYMIRPDQIEKTALPGQPAPPKTNITFKASQIDDVEKNLGAWKTPLNS